MIYQVSQFDLLYFQLKLEQDWDENPDKQILNWGGIKTEHQYSQGGNFQNYLPLELEELSTFVWC